MEFESGRDKTIRWTIDTPLLDSIDPERRDDDYLRELAEESGRVVDVLIAKGADFDDAIIVASRAYREALGIRASNNLHLWFNSTPFSEDEPFSGINNIDNPLFSDMKGVQMLRRLREQYPDVFELAVNLSVQMRASMRNVHMMAKARAPQEEIDRADTDGTVLSWKVAFIMTAVIHHLESEGIASEDLTALFL